MPLRLLLLALFFLNSTVLVFHVLYIYIYIFFFFFFFSRINLHCSLLRFVSFSYLQLPSSLSPLEHFSNRRFCNRQGEGNRNRHSDSKGSTPEMTPEELGLCQKEERDERGQDSKPETEENCVNRWFCPLRQLSPITPSRSFPHSTQRRLKISTVTESGPHQRTPLPEKTWGSAPATVSYTLLESELFPPPLLQATLGKKKRKQRRVGWGGDVARWSQRL